MQLMTMESGEKLGVHTSLNVTIINKDARSLSTWFQNA